MNERIKIALITLLKEDVLVASWGFSDLTIKDAFFEFYVSGLIYQGKVTVSVQKAEYIISLDNGDVFKCAIKDLVKCLDCIIEKTPDYEVKIIEWIKCCNPTPARK